MKDLAENRTGRRGEGAVRSVSDLQILRWDGQLQNDLRKESGCPDSRAWTLTSVGPALFRPQKPH